MSGEGSESNGIHKKVIWKNDRREAFAESIDLDEVGELYIFMDENVNNNIDVNALVDRCRRIMIIGLIGLDEAVVIGFV